VRSGFRVCSPNAEVSGTLLHGVSSYLSPRGELNLVERCRGVADLRPHHTSLAGSRRLKGLDGHDDDSQNEINTVVDLLVRPRMRLWISIVCVYLSKCYAWIGRARFIPCLVKR